MALAEENDVVARLGRNLTPAEQERIQGLLEEASDLTVGYLGCDPDPVPDAVTRVVSRMVARVFVQDESGAAQIGVAQVGASAGPFSRQVTLREGTGSGTPWLERTDKVRLRPYRCGGGMVSVSLSSDQSGR